MKFQNFYYSLTFLSLYYISCTSKDTSSLEWNTPFPAIGTQSSPRCTDLNDDGVLDIVIGAGLNEYLKTDHGVIALNGKNGTLLWAVPATDQIVGSPTFLDINRDGIQDIIIGGRSHNLMAINGKSGDILWKYKINNEPTGIKQYARFNFFNCQLVSDQNQDGLDDILAACGGNSKAAPHSMIGRYPGTLMILDAKSGNILTIDTMPDGKENYMSPVILQDLRAKCDYIIYGTGGETFGGNLYKVLLPDFIKHGLKNSNLLIHNKVQGFIAPPTLADLNRDSINEIIVSSHNGDIFCLDGASDSILWKREMNLESNNMFAPGYFNQDSVLDFFGYFAKSTWPNNNGVIEFVVDGKNGDVLFKDSIGSSGFSSPIAFQADDDKETELLIHINFGKPNTMSYALNRSQLILYDFPDFKRIPLDTLQPFKNISTTPWIGDLDGDKKLDLITCYLMNTYKIDEMNGMFVSRKKTDFKNINSPTWGEYMGQNGMSQVVR